MNFDTELPTIETQVKQLSTDTSKLDGQVSLLTEQIKNAQSLLVNLEETKVLTVKAIEVLQHVQKATRDKIIEAFENTVTFALRSIYNADFRFKLEFSQRGNIGELDFKVKSPDCDEYLDLDECQAGGTLDIVAIALRFVLLEIFSPRVEGLVLLDEGTKQLSRNFRNNEFNFYQAMSEKLNRQLILITHATELIEKAKNKIKIGD
jgi:DNA repair exonuclease SbcCD ATPase subunit